MKPLNSILPTFIILVTSCLITGCGNDLSLPKASVESSTETSANSHITTENLTTQSSGQPAIQSPEPASQTPPEKTSVWVTLAGMKCH